MPESFLILPDIKDKEYENHLLKIILTRFSTPENTKGAELQNLHQHL